MPPLDPPLVMISQVLQTEAYPSSAEINFRTLLILIFSILHNEVLSVLSFQIDNNQVDDFSSLRIYIPLKLIVMCVGDYQKSVKEYYSVFVLDKM